MHRALGEQRQDGGSDIAAPATPVTATARTTATPAEAWATEAWATKTWSTKTCETVAAEAGATGAEAATHVLAIVAVVIAVCLVMAAECFPHRASGIETASCARLAPRVELHSGLLSTCSGY
jgi:hypothetical protein